MRAWAGRMAGHVSMRHRASVGNRPRCAWSTRLLLAALMLSPAMVPAAAQTAGADTASRLPLPRFVSLKSDRVNMRRGPGVDYPTVWVFRRAGLPLEILQEVEGWRQVRDAEGATGWVVQAMLSGRRTALVLPWEVKSGQTLPQVPLRAGDREGAAAVAIVEAGVIANVTSCDGRWCRVSVGDLRGYVEQAKLWGVYPDEIVK
jgi:SH3-like domain-containing protein